MWDRRGCVGLARDLRVEDNHFPILSIVMRRGQRTNSPRLPFSFNLRALVNNMNSLSLGLEKT